MRVFFHSVLALLLVLGVVTVQAYVVGFEYHRFFTPSWFYLIVALGLCFIVPSSLRKNHLLLLGSFLILALYLGGRGIFSEVPQMTGKDYPVFYYGLVTFLAMLALSRSIKLFVLIIAVVLGVHTYQLLIVLSPNDALPKAWGQLANGNSGQGFFRHYNPFASYCAISLAGLCGLLLVTSRAKTKWFLKGISGLLAICTIFVAIKSGSRMGVTAMVITAFFCLMLGLVPRYLYPEGRLRSKNSLVVTIVSCVVGGILSCGFFLIVFNSMSEQRGKSGELGDDVMGDMRVTSIALGYELWQKNPVFGSGPRSYWYRVPGLRQERNSGVERFSDPEMVHNDYVQTLAEYGVVGLILILGAVGVILFLIWKTGYRQRFVNENWMLPPAIATSALIGIMVHSLADFTPHNAAVFVPLCLILGSSYGYLLMVEEREGFNKKVNKIPLASLQIVTLLASSAIFIFIGKNQIIHNIELVKYDYAKWNSVTYIDQALKVSELAPDPVLKEELGSALYQRAVSPEFIESREEYLKLAIEQFQGAKEMNPYRITPYLNLASLAIYHRDYEQAELNLSKAWELSNNRWLEYNLEELSATYLQNRGENLWYNKRNAAEAMSYFREALKYYKYWKGRGKWGYSKKKIKEVESYMKVLEAGNVTPDESLIFFKGKGIK